MKPTGPAQAWAIIDEVAVETGWPRVDIVGRDQERHIVQARHEAMRRIRSQLGWSYGMIGQLFQRDHTTVMYACGVLGARR